MSNALITLLIFWGGLLAVVLFLALDELAAKVGLQPKSARWLLKPFIKAVSRKKDKGSPEKKLPARGELALAPVTMD